MEDLDLYRMVTRYPSSTNVLETLCSRWSNPMSEVVVIQIEMGFNFLESNFIDSPAEVY